jgi:hypothetical protein
MKIRKLLVSALCAVSLMGIPVHAASICTHPMLEEQIHHGYDRNDKQHCEWLSRVFICTKCHAEARVDTEYENWEDHNWWIDYDNPDYRDYGIQYDMYCTECGYDDYIIEYYK